MKTFKLESRDFPDAGSQLFTEHNPPAWLIHQANKWFFDGHVMKLEVGDNVLTDFTKITRTS